MWPLCRLHHTERHGKPREEFISKYADKTIPVLKKKGWEFDKFMGKWMRLTKQGWEVDQNSDDNVTTSS